MVDLACVYEVDECPNCGKKDVEYSDTYEFCDECGYTFN
jgi:ribosomal protein L37AE/L43A